MLCHSFYIVTRDRSAAVGCAQKGKASGRVRNRGWSGVVDVGDEGECVNMELARGRERVGERYVRTVVRQCRWQLVKM